MNDYSFITSADTATTAYASIRSDSVKAEYTPVTTTTLDCNKYPLAATITNDKERTFTFKPMYLNIAKPMYLNIAILNQAMKIRNIAFFPPVTKVTFNDEMTVAAKAQDGDEFNEETGVLICCLKHFKKITGIDCMGIVQKAMKDYRQKEKEKLKAEKLMEEQKVIKERQKAKAERRKAAREEKAKQKALAEQEEFTKNCVKWILEAFPDLTKTKEVDES